MNEVIMAVDLRGRGTVGCAYYVAREEKLYMMEDIRFGGIEVIETCMTDTLVLWSPAGADTRRSEASCPANGYTSVYKGR